MKQGVLVPNGVKLEPHEYATVMFFLKRGQDIVLIPPSNRSGQHSPDIWLEGKLWEMKSPKGEGTSLMKNTLQKAARQAENVIIDLRRAKRHQTKCLKELEREFHISKRAKCLRIITKNKMVLEFVK